MKSLLKTGCVLALLAGGVVRGQDQIPWAADFRQACEQAAQQRRLVLIHFYADDCPPCVRVEQNVFSRPEVAAAIARSYVPVKVHAMQNRELAERYQVTRWPTDVAVTPAGLEIHRSTSPQVPEHYVELVNLMALKAGVGTDRQWAANMEQVGQATLAPATNIAQAAQGQQQWSQQAQDAAQQFRQQTQNAVQQYQTQVQDSAQQFQGQAASTAQQFQQQTLAAGQQAQTAAQPFGDAARAAAAPWQTAANQPPAAPQGALPPYLGVANPFFGQPQPQQPPPATSAWQPPTQQQQQLQQPLVQQQPVPHPQFVSAPQPAPAAAPQFVAASEAPPVCMDGFCPVTLLESKKWQKADPQFGAVHRGRTYLFASAEQQKKFLANPDAFAPVLSGYDPVRFATTGQLVEGNRAFGVITHGDNRIFLFADKAALEQFERSPRDYSEPAYQAMQRGTAPTYR